MYKNDIKGPQKNKQNCNGWSYLTKTCQNLMATFFAILNKMSEGSRNNSKYIYLYLCKYGKTCEMKVQ